MSSFGGATLFALFVLDLALAPRGTAFVARWAEFAVLEPFLIGEVEDTSTTVSEETVITVFGEMLVAESVDTATL